MNLTYPKTNTNFTAQQVKQKEKSIKRFIMRWKIIDNRKEGQERIISKYLYIPKRIGNEIRWLERVSIKQTLHIMFDVTCGACWWEWRDTEWVENVL